MKRKSMKTSSKTKNIKNSFLSSLFMVLLLSYGMVDAKAQKNVNSRSSKAAHTQRHSQTQGQKSTGTGHDSRSERLGTKLGTDFQFNDLSVRGKYQSALEGKVTVENEKPIEDLLDYRTHFNDRLEVAKGQR